MTAIEETYTAGPFGDRPMQTMSVRQHTLARIEQQLGDILATLEHLEERGLVDDLSEIRERLFEKIATEQEDADDKESAA